MPIMPIILGIIEYVILCVCYRRKFFSWKANCEQRLNVIVDQLKLANRYGKRALSALLPYPDILVARYYSSVNSAYCLKTYAAGQ
jgi:hypothetical protein